MTDTAPPCLIDSETSQEALAIVAATARDMLALVDLKLAQLEANPEPDWGDVGTAGWIVDQLVRAVDG